MAHSWKLPGLEAERPALTAMQGDLKATYQDKIWEKVAGDVSLRLRWHCYDPSHAYRAMRDVNVLSLELMHRDLCRSSKMSLNEHRFEDGWDQTTTDKAMAPFPRYSLCDRSQQRRLRPNRCRGP